MAVDRPPQPEAAGGSAAARPVPRTVPAANAPAAPRKNACREIPRPGFAGTVMSALLAHLVAEFGVPLAVSRND